MNRQLENQLSKLTRLYGATYAFLEDPTEEGYENLIDAVKEATPQGMDFQPVRVKILLQDLSSCNCDDPLEDMSGDVCLNCHRLIR